MKLKPKKGLLLRFNSITIIAVYFLILVGGIVRSTGSGMGCPDWPKCFGSYIPPTEESELPLDYKEAYKERRIEKNKRLANVLTLLGMEQAAKEVVEGESVTKEQPFNATKTWIEYINRLVGVVIGFLIIGCTVVSLTFWKTDKRVVVLSFLALLLVIFQGWTGSLVVSTNLLPGMITFHMIQAIALIALLLYTRFYVNKADIKGLVTYKPYKVRRLISVCIILFFVQVLLGTQVRESIDMIAVNLGESERWQWIDELGLLFYIHRSYSILLLVVHLFLIYRLSKSITDLSSSKILVWSLMGLVLMEIASGVVLAYMALPYYMQPVHLLLALMIFGIQYYLYLLINDKSSDRQLVNG